MPSAGSRTVRGLEGTFRSVNPRSNQSSLLRRASGPFNGFRNSGRNVRELKSAATEALLEETVLISVQQVYRAI
jgi:hypothetical protein